MAPKAKGAPASPAAPGKDPKAPPPEAEEEEPEPPKPEEPVEPEPESLILKGLGWAVCQLPVTKLPYYYSATRREARTRPPYYSVLGLDETKFRNWTKEDIWKAFFLRKNEYKVKEEGALTEDLIDRDLAVDWNLVMEAFHVLNDQEARAQYEVDNLMPHAQRQLQGLRIQHEAHLRHLAREEAQAKAEGYASAAEMHEAHAAAAKAAAEQAALEAEEEAKKAKKKR